MTELSQPHPVADLASIFWPRTNQETKALLAAEGLELSFNARGALLTAFQELRATSQGSAKPTILVPAFHCPSAITPAILAGLDPVFYRIRPDLSIDWDDVAAKTTASTTAILVIHFFGIAPDLTPWIAMRTRGIRMVEDCSHAFVSLNPMRLAGDPQSDYRVYSFWKLAACGVGGGLIRADSAARLRPEAPLRARLAAYKMLIEEAIQANGATGLRVCFSAIERTRLALRPRTAQTIAVLPSLENGEDYYPVHPSLARARMPSHVRAMLEASDLAAITLRRRDNFWRYQQHIQDLAPMRALIPQLPDDTCPWVYPVLLPRRDEFDRKLRAAGMALHTFGIYLHSRLFESADAATVADARLLAQQTLCLGIHQGLDPMDIDRSCHSARHILRSSLNAP